MDHNPFKSKELGTRVLKEKWKKRIWLKKRNKKEDKFGLHTPCTTGFTPKTR